MARAFEYRGKGEDLVFKRGSKFTFDSFVVKDLYMDIPAGFRSFEKMISMHLRLVRHVVITGVCVTYKNAQRLCRKEHNFRRLHVSLTEANETLALWPVFTSR